jgi:hypothetical protein
VVAQSPDMIQVVSVGQDRSLTFWDLRESQPLQVGPGGYCPPRHSKQSEFKTSKTLKLRQVNKLTYLS